MKYYDKDGIVIYHDDNLEVLRRLDTNSINLIYCDVLYNSGKTFDDYSDNLGSPTEAVEWYRPRFKEMKRVLAANGSIFIHCNWRLDSYLRILMDEIFGINNFRNRIYRKHSGIRGFYKNFDSQMDIILYYVNDTADFTFNEKYSDNNKLYPLFENGYVEGRSETRVVKGVEIDLGSKNKHWIISSAELEKIAMANLLKIIDDKPFRYANKTQLGNLWDGDEMLDPYDRTTTAVVAKKLGRKGIFCDISEKACLVTVNKLENN